MALSIRNVNCYKYAESSRMKCDFNDSCNLTEVIDTENEIGSIDLKNGIAKQALKSVKADYNGKTLADQENEVYLIGDTLYTKTNGKWTRSAVSDPAKALEECDKLRSLVKLIDSSDMEIVGAEMIDGQRCYKLKIEPEPHIACSMLSAQALAAQSLAPVALQGIGPKELSENNSLFDDSKIFCTVWISRGTYLPKKMEREITLALTPDCLKVGSESIPDFKIDADAKDFVLYRDFNVPDDMAVPEEAEDMPGNS